MNATAPAPARYPAGPRRGTSRELTPDEKERLLAVNDALSIQGARTAENAAPRDEAHKILIELFEDGVSVPTLARATGRTPTGVNQHLLWARNHGFGTGQRRYIAPAPREPQVRPRTTRDLTPQERDNLRNAYAQLPPAPAGEGRDWATEQGRALTAKIRALQTEKPRVPQSEIADALGVSRQALNQRLSAAA